MEKVDKGLRFSSFMSILVNGSTIKDFIVNRGLRQGDPLSFFLFMMDMERLTGLMKREASIGEFRGFHINEKVYVDLLQFVDDTIIIGDGSLENLWGVKEIHRGFK